MNIKLIIWKIKSIKCKLFGHNFSGDWRTRAVCKCCHHWIGEKK